MKSSILYAVILLLFALPSSAAGQQQKPANTDILVISGSVKDKLTGRQLPDAKVIVFNAKGEPLDTVSCRSKVFLGKEQESQDFSSFSVPVRRSQGTVTMDVECDGYNTYTLVKDLSDVHSRESHVTVPPVLLERAPHKLSEVTVTASK